MHTSKPALRPASALSPTNRHYNSRFASRTPRLTFAPREASSQRTQNRVPPLQHTSRRQHGRPRPVLRHPRLASEQVLAQPARTRRQTSRRTVRRARSPAHRRNLDSRRFGRRSPRRRIPRHSATRETSRQNHPPLHHHRHRPKNRQRTPRPHRRRFLLLSFRFPSCHEKSLLRPKSRARHHRRNRNLAQFPPRSPPPQRPGHFRQRPHLRKIF